MFDKTGGAMVIHDHLKHPRGLSRWDAILFYHYKVVRCDVTPFNLIPIHVNQACPAV